MNHYLSPEDIEFKQQVEECSFPIPSFDHRAHVRLAYVYLVENESEEAIQQMRKALLGLLESAGIDPSTKFHETLTNAWVLAVQHFMSRTERSESADTFIEKNPDLLNSKIMMSHYSAEVLFSDKARAEFVEPNLAPIPMHNQHPLMATRDAHMKTKVMTTCLLLLNQSILIVPLLLGR